MELIKLKFNSSQVLRTLLGLAVIWSMNACTGSDKADSADIASEEAVVEEVEYLVIDEHSMNDIPLTSKAEVKAKPAADQAVKTEKDDALIEEEALQEEEAEAEAYDIVMMEELHEDLLEAEYEAENTFVVTEAAVPIEETQTVVSYAKKDKNDAAFQVVSNLQTGEIEQITFVDKKHQDVYDVTAGLTGKEVKKLRKEMKHMVKKGQVFLYDDQSNIMYLMDAQNMVGDEITAADVETMEVQSIIWKDKKHHKKN